MKEVANKKFKERINNNEFSVQPSTNEDLERLYKQEVQFQQKPEIFNVNHNDSKKNTNYKKLNSNQLNCHSDLKLIGIILTAILAFILLVWINPGKSFSQNQNQPIKVKFDELQHKNKQKSEQINENHVKIGYADTNQIRSVLQTQVPIDQQRKTPITQLKNQIQLFLKKIKQSQKEIEKLKFLVTNFQNNNHNQYNLQPNSPKNQEKETSLSTRYKVRQHFRDFTPKPKPSIDRYDITIPIQNVVDSFQNKYQLYDQNSQLQGVKKSTYQRAIRLMQVTHNVNIKGQMEFDNFNFYSSAQEKYKAFQKTLREEYNYYDEKYQISKYNKKQIGICISLLIYNAAQSRVYLRSLDSIIQQQYENYHIVITNDASTDETAEYLKKYMEVNKVPTDKYTIINNQKNMGACHNTYAAGHEYCKLGQIMTYIDGDDALIGRQVFSLLNAVYQRQNCTVTYGQYLTTDIQYTINLGNVRAIPQKTLEEGTIRKQEAYYISHLKSMYVDVFRAVPEHYFQFDNGTWFDSAFDVVFMIPGIELSGTRVKFTNQLIYEYTGRHSPRQQQRFVKNLAYEKPPLKRLQDFSFVNNPKTKSYP